MQSVCRTVLCLISDVIDNRGALLLWVIRDLKCVLFCVWQMQKKISWR